MAKELNDNESNRYVTRTRILFYPDDPPEFYLLIMRLIKDKYYVTRASKHQIKHCEVNYYPSSGVITIDGVGRHPEKGSQALLALLAKKYPKRRGQDDAEQASTLDATSPPAPVFSVDLDDLDAPDDYDFIPSDRWDDEP